MKTGAKVIIGVAVVGSLTGLVVALWPRKSSAAPPGPGQGTVAVASDPAGATLSIDGADVGVTPWSGNLSVGPHTLTAALSGYQTLTETFTVATGSNPVGFLMTTIVPSPVPPTPTPGRPAYLQPGNIPIVNGNAGPVYIFPLGTVQLTNWAISIDGYPRPDLGIDGLGQIYSLPNNDPNAPFDPYGGYNYPVMGDPGGA